MITGKISSFQSLGAVDGPGVRFVVFFQGCPLKCVCCHNPETQSVNGGTEYNPNEIAEKVARYKEYFGKDGGVTLSGGEPLVQPEFATEILKECKSKGIHTCIDTSGYRLDARVKELLKYTDLVLLDIKHIDNEKCIGLTGAPNKNTLEFARYLSNLNVPVWIRQVLIPGYTDDKFDLIKLKEFLDSLNNVKKIELLPYHDLGKFKWAEFQDEYTLEGVKSPTQSEIDAAKEILGIEL